MDWRVVFYQEDNGEVPFLDWFDEQNTKIQDRCTHLIQDHLAVFGNELRRPIADDLRDGIRELRFERLNKNYRLLYFFGGQKVIALSHGLDKKGPIPKKEIDKAVERRNKYLADPEKHTYKA